MKKIVVDSSVMVKWCNSQDENWLEQSDQLLKDAVGGKIELYAPELAKYEIGNALLNKKMSLPQTRESLAALFSTPVKFETMNEEEAKKTIEMASLANITYYDAVFMVLAKKLNAILVTANPKHQRQLEDIKVTDLKNYH